MLQEQMFRQRCKQLAKASLNTGIKQTDLEQRLDHWYKDTRQEKGERGGVMRHRCGAGNQTGEENRWTGSK